MNPQQQGQRPPRHDAAPPAPAEKAPRHDNQWSGSINGFGNPFGYTSQNGEEVFWLSAHDMRRLRFRHHRIAKWGEPGIDFHGLMPGKDGEAVIYNDLTAHVMSRTDAAIMRASDPALLHHAQLRHALKNQAASAEILDESGKTEKVTDSRGYMSESSQIRTI